MPLSYACLRASVLPNIPLCHTQNLPSVCLSAIVLQDPNRSSRTSSLFFRSHHDQSCFSVVLMVLALSVFYFLFFQHAHRERENCTRQEHPGWRARSRSRRTSMESRSLSRTDLPSANAQAQARADAHAHAHAAVLVTWCRCCCCSSDSSAVDVWCGVWMPAVRPDAACRWRQGRVGLGGRAGRGL